MSLLKTSKVQMTLALSIFAVWHIIVNPLEGSLIQIIVPVLTCVVTDFVFMRLTKTPTFFPSAALVSGLIISLLTSHALLLASIVASVVAMSIKNLLRVGGRHIFNPAASGLLISSLVFQQQIAWWGTIVPLYLYIFPALVSIVRIRRYGMITSFIPTYSLLLTIVIARTWQTVAPFDAQSFFLNSFLDPTVLFFSLVMLPEPMTTPYKFSKQILFGLLVAIVSIGASMTSVYEFSIEPLIFSLLIANLVFFKLR